MSVVPIFDDIDETDEWFHGAELEQRAFEKTLRTNDKAHAVIDDLRERVAVLERERDALIEASIEPVTCQGRPAFEAVSGFHEPVIFETAEAAKAWVVRYAMEVAGLAHEAP